MELAVDQKRGRVYALGPCGYAGGYSVVTLPTATAGTARAQRSGDEPQTRLVARSAPAAICADRFVLGEDSQWIGVIGGRTGLIGLLAGGVVKILTARDASIASELRTDSPPVDIIAVP
jgi:hypothetical protein